MVLFFRCLECLGCTVCVSLSLSLWTISSAMPVDVGSACERSLVLCTADQQSKAGWGKRNDQACRP